MTDHCRRGINTYPPEGHLIATTENRSLISSSGGLQYAAANGKILEGMATLCDSNMNITVDLGGMRGLITREEAALCAEGETVKDIAIITRVGRAVCFKVISLERDEKGQPYALLSRRMAQQECMREKLMCMIPGDITDAKITHLERFGAFADIGCGLVSLMPVDCISVSRISHPRDRFYIGMNIRAIIKSIDYDNGRIYISHRELLGTWLENASAFEAGQTAAGIIRSIEDYGIFVELTPNLAGLAELRDDVTVGQTAAVYIKNIVPDRMKIKLVLVDSYRGELIPRRMKYFLDDGENHIDYWRYSPRGCSKVIETNFME
ncbi:MAG: S1 RNA-binding domain-containing protein [Eubacteriales bacterium]|jgi:small subunit ribosomal protein S1|nr:S1 RNA-binding domain-containing protein [Eubacteriales bacterium]